MFIARNHRFSFSKFGKLEVLNMFEWKRRNKTKKKLQFALFSNAQLFLFEFHGQGENLESLTTQKNFP